MIQLVHDSGIGNYNAFTFQVNKRFSNGFNLISSYTYLEIDGRHQRDPHPVIGALPAERPDASAANTGLRTSM